MKVPLLAVVVGHALTITIAAPAPLLAFSGRRGGYSSLSPKHTNTNININIPHLRVEYCSRLHAITPIGPFCPFRSSAVESVEPGMERLNDAGPEFATEMARIQLDMQMGNALDPERLRKVADGIDGAVTSWEDLLTRLNIIGDFQTREYAKLTQAHMQRHGQNAKGVAAMMRWQSACMRAIADDEPPPVPPPGIDVMKVIEEMHEQEAAAHSANDNAGRPSLPSISMAAMTTAEKITSSPFTGEEAVFESDAVRKEYERLCRDHAALINFGGEYDSFDGLGKVAFVDEIEKIEERWDVLFTRFSLMGALNEEYVSQCDAFLETMSLSEKDFRSIIKEAHNIMREDAERGRNT